MKAVDGWIAAAGVVVLGLAVLVILRARDATIPASRTPMPPANAVPPPDSAFPACLTQAQGVARWRCQAAQARREGRLRCIGQRLYYVVPQPGAAPVFYRWPPALQCWIPSTSSEP